MTYQSDAAQFKGWTDEQLIHLTLQGENRAFEELMRRHSRKLYNTLYQILESEQSALDVAQEAFIKAHSNLRYLKKTKSFEAWLFTIATNQAYKVLKKAPPSVSLDRTPDDNDDTFSPSIQLADHSIEADPARQTYLRELREHLRAALNKLTPKHRDVVIMCDIMNFSKKEVAAMLQVNEATLRTRLFNAHKELQGLLHNVR